MGDLTGGVLVPFEHQWMLLCAYTKRIGRYIARNTGLNKGLRLANERRDYFVTTSLIPWHKLRNSLAVYIRVKWCIRYRVQYVVLFFIPFYSHGNFVALLSSITSLVLMSYAVFILTQNIDQLSCLSMAVICTAALSGYMMFYWANGKCSISMIAQTQHNSNALWSAVSYILLPNKHNRLYFSFCMVSHLTHYHLLATQNISRNLNTSKVVSTILTVLTIRLYHA